MTSNGADNAVVNYDLVLKGGTVIDPVQGLHRKMDLAVNAGKIAALDDGDILTHCFRGEPNSLLDEQGRVLDELAAARQRGVRIDLGHGAGSFCFETARKMLAYGIEPDITVLGLESGEFLFQDCFGNEFAGDKRLVPVITIKDGQIIA